MADPGHTPDQMRAIAHCLRNHPISQSQLQPFVDASPCPRPALGAILPSDPRESDYTCAMEIRQYSLEGEDIGISGDYLPYRYQKEQGGDGSNCHAHGKRILDLMDGDASEIEHFRPRSGKLLFGQAGKFARTSPRPRSLENFR